MSIDLDTLGLETADDIKKSQASDLEAMYHSSKEQPSDYASASKIASDGGIPLDVVINRRDEAIRHAYMPDWNKVSEEAPKFSSHISSNPGAFTVLKNDAEKLAAVEKMRYDTSGEVFVKDIAMIPDSIRQSMTGAFMAGDSLLHNAFSANRNSNGWYYRQNKESIDGIVSSIVNNPDTGAQYNETRKYGMETLPRYIDGNQGINESALREGITKKLADDAWKKSPEQTDFVSRQNILTDQAKWQKSELAAESPVVKACTAPWVVDNVMQFTKSMAAGVALTMAGQPEAAAAQFFTSTASSEYADQKASGSSDSHAAIAAVASGAIESITEEFGAKAISEVSSGLIPVIKGIAVSIGDNLMQEHAAEIGHQVANALIDKKFVPVPDYIQSLKIDDFSKQVLANLDGQIQAGAAGAVGGGVMGAGGASVHHAGKAIADRIDARKEEKKQAILTENKNLLDEVQHVEGMDATHFATNDVQDALHAIDGDNERTVFVDPSQLLNQEGLSRQQVEQLLPSSAGQLDQALRVGGLVSVPRNELIAHLAATKDLDNESIIRHFKEDPTSDSKFEIEQAGIDSQIKQADILISKSADSEKLKTQRSEVYQQALEDLNKSGMFKGGNDKRASIWAAMATATAMRTGKTPMEMYRESFGRVTDEAAIGDAFNQPAYHGSPYQFGKFSLEHMGKGEGAQAYGWGLYFAGSKDVAEYYRETLKNVAVINGEGRRIAEFRSFKGRIPENNNEAAAAYVLMARSRGASNPADTAIKMANDAGANKEVLDLLSKWGGEGITAKEVSGQLYKVDIPEDDSYLLWDKPFSEQPKQIQESLSKMLENFSGKQSHLDVVKALIDHDANGGAIYGALDSGFGREAGDSQGKEKASKELHNVGISGIKYLDGSSRGTGEGNHNYVVFDDNAVKILDKFYQNKAIPRGTYDPATRNINLTHNADLSTFLHESGHMFLDIMADMAVTENASESLKKDMDVTMKWFGIDGDTPEMRLFNWRAMTINEKRRFHEKWAESFEQYLFEGKAPSIELAHVFSTFRQWLMHVYKSIAQFVSSHDGAKLNDEVRGVFDRMLATEQQIQEAEAARGLLPLFDKKPDNMTDAEWKVMQQAAEDSARSAFDQMTARSLRDMKWLSNAKNKTLRKLQREAEAQRREAHMEARQQIMSQGIYRAWQFLKAPIEGAQAANKKAKASKEVDSSRDSLLTAIAKLGGLNMEQAVSQYGLESKDFHHKSGVFGMPVLRKTGGMSPDAMGEALSQYGYLPLDEHGKWDIQDLEDKLSREAGGNPQYSVNADYDVLLGDTRYAATPDAESVDFVGGRISRQAIRETYDDIDLQEMQGSPSLVSKATYGDGNEQAKQEIAASVKGYGQGDLFSSVQQDGGKNTAADKKRKGSGVESRDVQPSGKIQDKAKLATVVGRAIIKRVDIGFDSIDTPKKAAAASSFLYKSPQESMLVIAVDKDGKPISMLRHTLGLAASTSVDPGIVAGWAINTPGATKIWLSHNHPSGISELSAADKRFSASIADLMRDSGVESAGIIAVGEGGEFSYDPAYGASHAPVFRGKQAEKEKESFVDVQEREFERTAKYSEPVDQNSVISVVRALSNSQDGIMLLDTQMAPVGYLPIDWSKADKIRGTDTQRDILAALEASNAQNVVFNVQDKNSIANGALRNIASIINMATVNVVDAVIAGESMEKKGNVPIGQNEYRQSLQGISPELQANTDGPLPQADEADIVNKLQQKDSKDSNDNRTLETMGVLSDEGLHPDTVADLFGLSSGDELVRKLLTMPDPVAEIERLTDEIMLQRHADLATPEARERAAEAAIHNEAHVKFLATELTALNRAIGKPRLVMAAAKEYANNIVAGTKIKDLKPGQYVAAEAKAGKAAEKAFASGNRQDAALQKRNQVLHAMTINAVEGAKDEVEKAKKFFNKIAMASNKKNVTRGRDPDVVNAINAIIAQYGFYPSKGNNALEYLKIVEQNDPEMFAHLEPAVMRAMTDGKSWRDMTYGEFMGFRESIDGLWYLAKRSREMEINGNRVSLEEAAGALHSRMVDIGIPDSMPGDKGALTSKELIQRKLQAAGSLLRRVEQWAEAKDGKYGGAFLRYIFQPVKLAADNYRHDKVKYRKAFTDLIKALPVMKRQAIEAPELGYTFGAGELKVGLAELLHAVLHTGNESNKRKLLLGRGWAREREDGSLDTGRWDSFVARMVKEGKLTKEHFAFAQGVWDLLEETKPLAQKAHREVFGHYFAEVTADQFGIQFPDGEAVTYRGGYVPAQTDTRIVNDAAVRALADQENQNMSFAFPSTSKGFTKSRVEYNKPLLLDIRSLTQHMDKVLLFSHMEAPVRDVAKLLKRTDVSEALYRIDPTAVDGMLQPWLARSARQAVETPILGDGQISKILSVVRSRAGMALMMGNISNTIQQVTGFSSALTKVKARHIRAGIAAYLSDPKGLTESVASASIFMRDRIENEVSELSEQMNEILIDPTLYQKGQAWAQKHAYFLQSALDNAMGPMIWTGAYNQSIEEGFSHDDAVQFANGVIRQTQGTTLPEDVSRIETGPAYGRAFTQFIGYFNMLANTNATELIKIQQEIGLKNGRALGVVFFGVLAPAWIAEAIALAFKGGPDDPDDDGYLDDWLSQVIGMGLLKNLIAGVPFAGTFLNVAINNMNKNPSDDRASISPAIGMLESGAAALSLPYHVAAGENISAKKSVTDIASLVTVATGLPARPLARPLGYLAGMAQDKINPTGGADLIRGMATGTASPDSKAK